MALSLTIVPLSNELSMYGELDQTCAYSLSGHISLSISPSFSLFESRRSVRLLLQSLSLTFEGQSEIYTPSAGYSSLRLCSVTQELISSGHLELSNEGHEDNGDPCVWNVIFNLPIPGWLPETTSLGIQDLGVRYALYATAKFTNIVSEEVQSSWGFASLYTPFRSRVRSVQAVKPVSIRRFITAPRSELSDIPFSNYLVNSTISPMGQAGKEMFPPEVLSNIQVMVSIPEYVDMTENAIPLTLRLCISDLPEEYCKRLQVTELAVDIFQQEKFRYRPSASFLSRFPLPPKEQQPPCLPLRNPHPIGALYDVGLYLSSEVSEAICRTFSLLPGYENGLYELPANNYLFMNQKDDKDWYTMDTSVPFIHHSDCINQGDLYDASIEWAGEKNIRPTSNSPLYSVLHDLSISLTCTYDLEGRGGEVAKAKLHLKVPVTFGKVAPLRLVDPVAQTETSLNNLSLPAYSELFDSNGDRKIDYSVALPVYSPSTDAVLVDLSNFLSQHPDNVYQKSPPLLTQDELT